MKEVIPGRTVKVSVLSVLPPALVTVTGPVTAAAGTVTRSWVALTMVKEAAAPPILTELVPVNVFFLPVPLNVLPLTRKTAPDGARGRRQRADRRAHLERVGGARAAGGGDDDAAGECVVGEGGGGDLGGGVDAEPGQGERAELERAGGEQVAARQSDLVAGLRRWTGPAVVSFGSGLNTVVEMAVPAAVVTSIVPTGAVAGTLATIAVAVFETTAATIPPNVTLDADPNPVPAIVTFVSATAAAGVKEVIPGRTVKVSVLSVLPPALVTVTGPVTAAAGTVTRSWVALTMVKEAAAPPILTELVPVNVFFLPVPLNVLPLTRKTAPAAPEAGDSELIVGRTLSV